MKLFFLSISFICFSVLNFYAQEIGIPTIEIVGMAEKEITPDEIFISVNIKEYYKGKQKISIQEQEEKMLNDLNTSGIRKENIKLNNSGAGYQKVKVLKKDVLVSKYYSIKTANSKEIENVFKVLSSFKNIKFYVSRVNYSKIQEIKRALRIQAIKDAKSKAEDLVGAIGNKLGKPILIKETGVNVNDVSIRGSRSDATNYYIDGVRVSGSLIPESKIHKSKYKTLSSGINKIEYKTIKVKASIFVKFLIE